MLERLAQRIDREHRLGEASQAKALASYRRYGELLLRAKRLVGRGRWIAWLRANVKIKRRRVEQYMELAQSTAPLDWQQSKIEAELWGMIGSGGSVCRGP